MKNLMIVIIFFSFTMMSKQGDYISIEHIGLSDKPILTIIISKSIIEKENCMNYVVNDQVYKNIKNTVELYKENKQNKNQEYGSFKITIYERGTKSIYYYLDRKKSIVLFDQIINILSWKNKNSQKLLLEFLTVRKRISY
jgi:hypothetical protein